MSGARLAGVYAGTEGADAFVQLSAPLRSPLRGVEPGGREAAGTLFATLLPVARKGALVPANIFYIIGVIVVIAVVLSYLGIL